MNLNDLHTFLQVADLGTFAGAAIHLGVPRSTVSRRVSRLEAALGIALLNRTSRSLVLTEDGRALQARCGPAIREISEAERGLRDSNAAPRGQLTLTAPIDLGASAYLASVISAYAKDCPEVRVDLQVSNRTVDLLEQGVDIAFRIHARPLPDRDDLMARRLGTLNFDVYGSPTYLAENPVPTSMSELANHRTVAHTHAHRGGWPTEPTLTCNDYWPVAALLASGTGLGGLPRFVAAPWLERGALVKLDMAWTGPVASLSLIWLRSRHMAPRIRAFLDRVPPLSLAT